MRSSWCEPTALEGAGPRQQACLAWQPVSFRLLQHNSQPHQDNGQALHPGGQLASRLVSDAFAHIRHRSWFRWSRFLEGSANGNSLDPTAIHSNTQQSAVCSGRGGRDLPSNGFECKLDGLATEAQGPAESPNVYRGIGEGPAASSEWAIPTAGEGRVDAGANVGAASRDANKRVTQGVGGRRVLEALKEAAQVKQLDEDGLELGVCGWHVPQEVGDDVGGLGGRCEGSGGRCNNGSIHPVPCLHSIGMHLIGE